jgi:UDP-N-acetylglucosamine 4-epimerase
MNVACGDQITLNGLINILNEICNSNITANYLPERKGDVKHSKADITKISTILKYNPLFKFETGLKIVFDWYKKMNI